MMRTLLAKTLYDKRWFILGWSLVIIFTVGLTVTFYPTLSHGKALEELAKSTPGQLKGLVGSEASMSTVQGYVAEQLYNFRIPLMIMIMALILAQSLSVADEEKGTLRTLTALPLSRTRILWERWLAGVIIFAIMILVTAVTALISSWAINETLPVDFSLKAAVVALLFSITTFSIMYVLGVATGSRAITMTVGLVLIMGGFILTTFGASVDWLKDWEILSLMHYANTSDIIKGDINRLNMWIMTLLSATSLLVGTVLFRRRDIS